MGSSWNLPLYEQVVAAIRDENLALGVNWVLSPEVDIAKDPRNGRNNEMFGEDTHLVSEFATRYIKVMQEKDDNGFVKVATTIKHFVYGLGSGGVNRASMFGGINHILNDLGLPYYKAIKEAEPLSLMVSYSTVDRVPMSINRSMLQDVLRGILGFKGLIMSDANSILNLVIESKVASSELDAAKKALSAGLQHELSPGGNGLFTTLINAVNDTSVTALVNDAVVAILEIKFATGVFDLPLPTLENLNRTLRNERHLELSRNMSRESIVMLKNEDILPLKRSEISKIAVIGAYADMVNAGMYAACNDSDPAYGDSFRRSLARELGDENVLYVPGVTALPSNDSSGIPAAVAAAQDAGIAFVVLGSGWGSFDPATFDNRRTDGEGFAHAELGFPGLQQELLDAVLDTGVPTILVISAGQTFVLNESTMRSKAILHAWLSGEFHGDALVETLFGDVNPSGKLTVTMPQANGAFPVAYDYLASDDQGGFGTAIFISPPVIVHTEKCGGGLTINATITNTGTVSGKEVVQVYYRPIHSIIEFPVMKLIRFTKVNLSPGESKDVTLTVPYNELGFFVDGKWHVESGDYAFWVGSSSRDEDLQRLNVTLS
ncbi:putative periplasmic beta-glucosidase protein [Phaeoacremonium minimum UCRPA7]|uniref:beta-glucosidase n=1 Tax=Phaeoacremonium minimum (strain UCR-PA7) TaxID=1286976 RepID=R8B9M6_PHAM7|nr:putative periplasmic beta-glucosidase protein [Phaeoacremonium minimum UCRPA7]EON95998.1 putative periplasmic beta-glucosidase protein [Phaeoacremonium minimum UCRPA7]